MKPIFSYEPCVPCGQHEDKTKEQRQYLSCPCGLADAGCFGIVWDGPGLGFVCETEEEAKYTVHRMNTAWYLAQGIDYDKIVMSEIEENRSNA